MNELGVIGLNAHAEERIRSGLADITSGLIVDASHADELTGWEDLEQLLFRAFALFRSAKQQDKSVVVIVHADDLLGRRGALAGMAASALTSCVRTLALEARKLTLAANIVATDSGQDLSLVTTTVRWLLTNSGVTGQLVTLGRGNLGKVQS